MTYRGSVLRDLYPNVDDFILAMAERMSDPRQVVLAFNEAAAATGSAAWAPGQKVKLKKISIANGDVAIAAATNTTAIGIDVYNAAGDTKQADVADKANTVAIAALASLDMTLSTTEDDLIIEATESLQVIRTIVGGQGEMSLVVSYEYVD